MTDLDLEAIKAREEALKRFPEPVDIETGEPVDDWGDAECSRESFIDGAAYALSSHPRAITDDMIETGAKGIHRDTTRGSEPWESVDSIHAGKCLRASRAALEAVLGENQ
ncbi:hypothetical protein [Kocuria sp. TGY1127_2]|uniref:hypothetical protein n=1 Tax=Kocuria sp. TGY1127_2 TaxID=2711328 RepID=UPI0015BB12AD|nr:hypothetical protein [Kocuria sp. TGY1127_2]